MKRKDWRYRIIVGLTMAAPYLAQTALIEAEQFTTGIGSLHEPRRRCDAKAARDGKYLFVYFWKQNDQQTRSMRALFQGATGKMTEVTDIGMASIPVPKPSTQRVRKRGRSGLFAAVAGSISQLFAAQPTAAARCR